MASNVTYYGCCLGGATSDHKLTGWATLQHPLPMSTLLRIQRHLAATIRTCAEVYHTHQRRPPPGRPPQQPHQPPPRPNDDDDDDDDGNTTALGDDDNRDEDDGDDGNDEGLAVRAPLS